MWQGQLTCAHDLLAQHLPHGSPGPRVHASAGLVQEDDGRVAHLVALSQETIT